MEQMNITSAQYKYDPIRDANTCIIIFIDGKKWVVPLDPANRHYAELMRQVEAGTLTIQDAD